MAKKVKETYVCSHCGSISPQWRGQCGQCGEWNTLEVRTVDTRPLKGGSASLSVVSPSRPTVLKDVSEEREEPFGTGMSELDRILGQGLVPGAALLFGGEPGIGKSTLLLQIAGSVARSGRDVLYVSGEESLGQLKGRAERLGALEDSLTAMATYRLDDVLVELEGTNSPALVIVDSVQTLSSSRTDGLPGSVSQVRAVSTELIELCKRSGTTLLLVGHVTKDGQLAGPKLMEHMVDTVISLEGDRRQMFRMLRVFKNRFGPNHELLVFEMVQNGMQIVDDPSTYFLGARDTALSGTAVVMAIDGQRPFAVEVQALVSRSYLAIPRRTGLGFDVNRLHLLLAVLEKRLRLNFGEVDIYAKIGGGMKIQDPGMDLALVAAILSSFYDLPLPQRSVLWGEVDLNGQIRPVAAHDIRLSQAKRLGYTPILHPEVVKEDGGIDTMLALQEVLFKKA